ncbi:MAG: YicC family protein [Silicimonas sp.]|jgi:uncharacterized protein (TIGR00255 family)|nr:YicC family protein [Silicimonas sp.]
MKDAPMPSAVNSMTGFAAVQGSFSNWTWSADIRSVNGRSLDLRFRMPDIEGLEPEIRKRFQARLGRGNVTVQVKLQRDEAVSGLAVNPATLSAALQAIAEIDAAARGRGVDTRPVSAAEIAAIRGVIEVGENDTGDTSGLKDALLDSLSECLDAFVQDRAREGAALASVISEQIDRIEALTKAALEAVGDREAAQKAAMERALARLLDAGDMPDKERLSQELALIAVKTDVTEELDRLDAHIGEARALRDTEGPVGRKFDFLMQEFNREANTLCSKAQSGALTRIGIDLKTVIDQMREQVQNIE